MKMVKWKHLNEDAKKGRRTHRRGLRPLTRRLTKLQAAIRVDKIALRAETKALAKIVQRRAARKGTKK